MSLVGIIVSVYEYCYNDIYIVMFVNIYDYVCVRPNQFNVPPPPVLMHSLYVWDGITFMLLISVIHGTVVLVMWFW